MRVVLGACASACLSLLLSGCAATLSDNASGISVVSNDSYLEGCNHLGNIEKVTNRVGFASSALNMAINQAAENGATHVKVLDVQNLQYFGRAVTQSFQCHPEVKFAGELSAMDLNKLLYR